MNKVYLKKAFNKKDFNTGASTLKLMSWYITNLLLFRSGLIPFSGILVLILRLFGAKIGKDVRIKPFIYIRYPWKLVIGDHSWLADCYIDNLMEVYIGNNVCISQQALLLTGNHDYTNPDFNLINKSIALEDGVWIAARAIVCPGITAENHAVLLAGAIATENLQPYSIYQGTPAKYVRRRIFK